VKNGAGYAGWSGKAKKPVKKARETLSGLLDIGSTANRPDEFGFAGVCPTESL
jgi:hypothetical protein